MSRRFIIGIDAMGGDFAPDNELLGAQMAYEELSNRGCDIMFFGQETAIRTAAQRLSIPLERFSLTHTEETVTMHDEPASIVKKKRNSSMYRGIDAVRENVTDAFVSAGNTGAVMATGTVVLGRVKGVARPTIGTFFPTITGTPTLMTDAGANVDCKSRHLLEFAIMGSIYYREIIGIPNPKVGLLNVGEEPTKGNEVVLETYDLLKQSGLNFVGNVEGRDIMTGDIHVVVCDGFTGNIVLKFAESIITVLRGKISGFAEKSLWNKVRVGTALPTLKSVLKDMDYQQYGGVPLLGVNGVVIIGHGKSTPTAIKNMLLRAAETAERNIPGKIESYLLHRSEH